MGINIGGKPLNEWIEEQKKKDGVLIVHQGTVYTEFGSSTYNGAIVTTDDNKDLCYHHADISIRIKGKEYRMNGKKVERIGGQWFVNGKKADVPVMSREDLKAANDQLQVDVTEQLNSAYGIVNHFGKVAKTTVHTSDSTIVNGDKITMGRNSSMVEYGSKTRNSGSGGRRVSIKSGEVRINRDGKQYTIKGKNIEQRDGQWTCDGKPVDWNDIGGEYDSDLVRIEIYGDVQNLSTRSGNVSVHGNCASVSTASGNVYCNEAGVVHTMSGDVHANSVGGDVSTMSGDIYKG